MNWTTTPPTQVGHYWTRDRAGKTELLTTYRTADGILRVENYEAYDLPALDRQWHGPLQPPADTPTALIQRLQQEADLADSVAAHDKMHGGSGRTAESAASAYRDAINIVQLGTPTPTALPDTFYTIADHCTSYGHGDPSKETHIKPLGSYGTGPFPPLFTSQDAATTWLQQHRPRYHLHPTIVPLTLHTEPTATEPRPIIVSIQRDDHLYRHAHHYTGHNEHGPCWSSISKCHPVSNLEDLRTLLKDIARHEPTVRAILVPDSF